ncbi:MAG: hypothetical protein Q9O74_06690 [Planctomycetota bacterium]|nr:hypothetical protein [Planctomycetota bacterium]
MKSSEYTPERLQATRLSLANGGPEDKPVFPIEFMLYTMESDELPGSVQVLEDRKVLLLPEERFVLILEQYATIVARINPRPRDPDMIYSPGTVIGHLLVDDVGKEFVFQSGQAVEILRAVREQMPEAYPAVRAVNEFAHRLGLNLEV